MERIYYTLDEARRILPAIKPILKKLITFNVKIAIQDDLTVLYDDEYDDLRQGVMESKQWHKTNYEYFHLLEQLTQKGIFVKDPALGLIDFFSLYKDREIFLCYHYPEQTVTHWHEVDEGFAGRKSVTLLKKHTSKKC